MVYPAWAPVCAAGFSAWHHLGPMGEPFALEPFVFRTVCGRVFTAIFAFRGFSPAVWIHALYDVWVMVLSSDARPRPPTPSPPAPGPASEVVGGRPRRGRRPVARPGQGKRASGSLI